MEVKMEVKPASGLEVKRKRWTIPQGTQTIVHEQSELTPTSVSELTPHLTPDLTPSFNFTTELCVDLKTILRSDRRAKMRKDYTGVLTRDGREHFTFMETLPQGAVKRNPHVYEGRFINISLWADGSLHPSFKNVTTGRGFSVESYAFGVACELREGLSGLVEEEE